MFSIKNIGKKLLICSASLMMMSSLASGTVSAKHVTTNKSHVSRIYKNSHKVHLTFNQLKKLSKLYYKNFQTIPYDHGFRMHMFSVMPHAKRVYWECNQYVLQNLNKFNSKQLNYLYNDLEILDNTGEMAVNKQINHIKITSTNDVNKLSHQDNQFDTQIRNNLVNDINQTRISYGRKPLIVTNVMQQVANYRAPKVLYAYEHEIDCLKYEHLTPAQLRAVGGTTDNWIHGEDTHTSASDYLQRHGYYNDGINANGANAGAMYSFQNISANDRAPYKYPNDTPQHIAYNINDDYMNHDKFFGNNNGHRDNELDPTYKYLGVGVTYDPYTHVYANNEQFAE